MFPALPIEFYGVFIDRIKEKGFCNERLIDAVNHVIDNCQYPTPTAANFLSFDKKSKIYTYQEILSLVDKGDSFSNYTIITINNKKFWDRK